MKLMPGSNPSPENGVKDGRIEPASGLVDAPIIINVKVTHGYNQYEVCVPSDSTFGNLKAVIAQTIGSTPEMHKLLFRGKEKYDDDNLQAAGVKENSKVLLMNCMPWEEKAPESLNETNAISRGDMAVSEVRVEVDKLAEQISALQTVVNSGTKVDGKDILYLTEMLMRQLLKLDSIEAEGEGKVKRKQEVQRVQRLVETMDILKSRNSSTCSEGSIESVTAPWQTFESETGNPPVPTPPPSSSSPPPSSPVPLHSSSPSSLSAQSSTPQSTPPSTSALQISSDSLAPYPTQYPEPHPAYHENPHPTYHPEQYLHHSKPHPIHHPQPHPTLHFEQHPHNPVPHPTHLPEPHPYPKPNPTYYLVPHPTHLPEPHPTHQPEPHPNHHPELHPARAHIIYNPDLYPVSHPPNYPDSYSPCDNLYSAPFHVSSSLHSPSPSPYADPHHMIYLLHTRTASHPYPYPAQQPVSAYPVPYHPPNSATPSDPTHIPSYSTKSTRNWERFD